MFLPRTTIANTLLPAVFLAALVASPGPALGGTPATVSGTITDVASTDPIDGATVVISEPVQGARDGGVLATGTTDVSGAYSIGVPMESADRDIIVEAASSQHAPARHNGPADLPCFFNCSFTGGEFTISPGGSQSGVDIALETGGTISGTITDASTGSPLETARVELLTEERFRYSTHFRAFTDAAGDYSLPLAMAPGDRYVYAIPSNSDNFVIEAWDDHSCQHKSCPILDTDTVTLVAGADQSGIDFALDPGAIIGGQLQPDTIGRIVRIYSGAGIFLDLVALGAGDPPDWSFDGLAGGSYYVELGPFTGNSPRLRILHNDLLCPFGGCNRARGSALSVPPGASLTLAEIELPLGGRIEGEIVDRATGSAPSLVTDGRYGTYDIIDSAGEVVGGGLIREDTGNLVMRTSAAVPPGDYFVRTFNEWLGAGIGYDHPGFNDDELPGYMDATYADADCAGLDCDLASATPVTVSADSITSITIEITTGSNITGSIVDDDTGSPIEEALVKLVDSSNDMLAATFTDSAGNFSFGAFPAGTYYLRTAMSAQLGPGHLGFQHSYFDKVHGATDNCSEQLCDPTGGTAIMLDGSTDAGPFELRVDSGPIIFGRVVSASTGLQINSGFVEVFTDSGEFVGSYRISHFTGQYRTTALAPGDYTVVPVVSPAYSDATTTSPTSPSSTSLSARSERSDGGLVVTVGTEDIEANLRAVDDGLDQIFRSRFHALED